MTQALPKDIPQTLRRWKRYPDYKDSGVEWLREIPEHWETKKVKHASSVFVPQRNKPELNLDSGLPWITMDDITSPSVDSSVIGYYVNESDALTAGSRALPPGCVIASCVGNFGVASVNKVTVIINQQLQAYIPKKIDSWFLRYLVEISKPYFEKVATATTLVYVNQERFGELPIVSPPIAEQQAIASFLDRETAKIDALIAKKERLIELLQEKRTAIISHAVTKGLDPTVLLQDSGVEWLGEIPTHWEVKRIKYLAIGQDCGIQMGPFGGMLKDLSVEETGFKVYGQENTINDDFTAGHRWITHQQLLEMARYAVRQGDLLLTRKGSIGKCRVVPDDVIPGIIDSDTIRVRVNEDRILKGFLVRLMHEAWYLQEQIVWNSRGAILTGLNTTTIAELRVAVPPLSEQKEIVASLEHETIKIDALIAKIRQGIEKLKEYRTALISAAVTGKIDVRNEVA